jgi:hypothetical protein
MQNSYRAFDSVSELAFRGPGRFCPLGIIAELRWNPGAKSGVWSARVACAPEAVEPAHFGKQERLVHRN